MCFAASWHQHSGSHDTSLCHQSLLIYSLVNLEEWLEEEEQCISRSLTHSPHLQTNNLKWPLWSSISNFCFPADKASWCKNQPTDCQPWLEALCFTRWNSNYCNSHQEGDNSVLSVKLQKKKVASVQTSQIPLWIFCFCGRIRIAGLVHQSVLCHTMSLLRASLKILLSKCQC